MSVTTYKISATSLQIALSFNVLCIFIFWIIYVFMIDDFHFPRAADSKDNVQIFDVLLLSTTIQAGVGVTNVYPNNARATLAVVAQQLIMIIGNVILISSTFIKKNIIIK